MKLKKIFLGLGAMGAIAAPVAAVISCNSDDNAMITHINKYENLVLKDDTKDLKTVLITDAGRVDDKSFNQSAWEAIETIEKQLDLNVKAIQPESTDKIEEAYNTALKAGFKVWVLPGYNHKNHIFKFYNTHKEEMKDVTIIGLDLPNKEDVDGTEVTIPKMYGLNYKTQQTGYLAGVAAAEYLRLIGDESPKLGAFGGGDFAGVTRFAHGFLEGILAYDKAKSEYDVQFALNAIELGTGFTGGSPEIKAAIEELKKAGADIILPIAGPATGDAILDTNAKIIGVDADQRIAYADEKGRFLTSIIKGIGQSTYDSLVTIYTTKQVAGFENFGVINKGIADNWTSIVTDPSDENMKKAINYATSNDWKTKAENQSQWHIKKDMTTGNKGDLDSIITEINKKN